MANKNVVSRFKFFFYYLLQLICIIGIIVRCYNNDYMQLQIANKDFRFPNKNLRVHSRLEKKLYTCATEKKKLHITKYYKKNK